MRTTQGSGSQLGSEPQKTPPPLYEGSGTTRHTGLQGNGLVSQPPDSPVAIGAPWRPWDPPPAGQDGAPLPRPRAQAPWLTISLWREIQVSSSRSRRAR